MSETDTAGKEQVRPTDEDLMAALRAAKELIWSLREYNKSLATQVDDLKEQVDMLKEKLYETTVPDEKAVEKARLQEWLREAAHEKQVQNSSVRLLIC